MQPVQRVQKLKDLIKTLPFQDKQSIEDQLGNVVYQLGSLSPLIDNYVFNDGTTAKLLKLDGTLPITYNGAQYNIPVAFWFPMQFPKTAPMCYVTPVQGMKVKPRHLHVDAQGVIYHPYLHEWSSKSSLIDLIGLLCSVFGKDPPVFAERKSAVHQPNQFQQVQVQNQNQYQNQYQNQNQIQNQYQNQYQSQNQYQQPNNHLSQPVQQVQQSQSLQHSQSLNAHQHVSNQNNLLSQSVSLHGTLKQSQQQSQQQSQLTTQDLQKMVEVEVRKSLQEYYDKENNELNMLAGKQKELDIHKHKIDEMKKTISQENQLLIQRKKDLESKIKSLEQWLDANDKDDIGNVDDVIQPSDVWSKQCMEAVSEDFALNDVMLELDKALEEETIQLDVYLKQMRKIAREQFMKRALAKEVHKAQDSIKKF